MKIRILLFGKLRDLATRETDLSVRIGSKIVDLIECLANIYGDDFSAEIRDIEQYNFLINGRYFDPRSDAEMLLKEGDVVAIMPLISGG